MIEPTKYAYFVVNDSDDLEELQKCLAPFGGVESMKDVIIDYALDKRRITDLIKYCNKHDVIYTPYLARLGKSLKELYQIVKISNACGVELVFCDKLTFSFSENNFNGQINLASLQCAVDLDFAIRSENHKARCAKDKDSIFRNGFFLSNDGEKKTHIGGNAKGTEETKRIMAIANEASCIAKQESAILWREQSKAYKRALYKFSQGWTLTQIVEDLSDLYDVDPENYCTPKGCKPTKGTVSKWLSEAKDKEDNVDI